MVAKHYYGQSIQLLLMEMHFIPYPGRCFSALTLPSHHHSNQTLYVCEHVCTCVLTHLYVCAHTRGSWENMIEGLVKIMATFLPNLDQEISLKIVQILAQKSCPNLAQILPESCHDLHRNLVSNLVSLAYHLPQVRSWNLAQNHARNHAQNIARISSIKEKPTWKYYDVITSSHGMVIIGKIQGC